MTVSNEPNNLIDELSAQRIVVYFMASFMNEFESKQNAKRDDYVLGEIGDCLSRSIRDSQADETGFCQAKAYLASDLGANERCREVTASASSEREGGM